MYKPRPLGVETRYLQLLTWLAAKGSAPDLRGAASLCRNGYGWCEFIAPAPCESLHGLRRFYERVGAHLALTYALEGTDFHYENLIAAGEHPVLVDLEALFHPRLTPESSLDSPGASARQHMHESVLRVGLLPERIVGPDGDGVEMSGVGGADGQLTPTPVLIFDGVGTDDMRAARRRIPMLAAQNRPMVEGVAADAYAHADDIVAGFVTTYRTLVANRNDLLAPGGPVDAFSIEEVRVVLRATRLYGQLLQESYHPDALRDAADRDRLLSRLWVGMERSPERWPSIGAETADLQRGDIPLFTAQPCSRDLITSSGVRIYDFFREASGEAVRRRCIALDEHDLARQVWFIRGALTTVDDRQRRDATRMQFDESPSEVAPPSTAEILGMAGDVAERLEMLAQHDGRWTTWLGIELTGERFWTVKPLGHDLYGGTSGLALFLGYVGSLHDNTRWTDLARRVVANLIEEIDTDAVDGERGAFSGRSSVAYVLTHLGVLWNDDRLLTRAALVSRDAASAVAQDRSFDVLAGAAGLIGTLLSLWTVQPTRETLDAVRRCADHLVTHARPWGEDTLAWVGTASSSRPLTGYSHGAAGIAAMLLRAAAATGDQKYATVAGAALAYERSMYNPEHRNWPDFRVGPSDQPGSGSAPEFAMNFWCHGAPGIALGRLSTLDDLDDAAVRQEIYAALGTTDRYGFGHSHSLCHGDLGNLDALIEGAHRLDDSRWHAALARRTSSVIANIRANGWICGVPNGIETPGFMAGLAGIGYGLLRVASPERVPSVLSLAPPVGHAASSRSSDRNPRPRSGLTYAR